MKQREVQDQENTRWTCVQAFSGTNNKASEEAAKQVAEGDNKVAVVCTPSGGAQTVRLNLDLDWYENISDEDLLRAIAANR